MTNNFFNVNDPLNLAQGTPLTNPKLNNPMYRYKYNTDSSFREQELKRVQEEQEASKKKLEEASQASQKQIAKDKSEKFVQKLSSSLKESIPSGTVEDFWRQAEQETINDRNPRTGALIHPAAATKNFMKKWQKQYQEEKAFESQYNDINNLVKFANSSEEEDAANFRNEVFNYAFKTKQIQDQNDFNTRWDKMSIRDKSLSVVNALGDKYLQGDALDVFKALDPQSKYEMLCAVTTADPRYKTMSSKLKELTEEKSNEASEGWLSTIGLGKSWRDFTDYATNRLMQGLVGGNAWYNIPGHLSTLGAGVFATVGHLGNMVGSAVDKGVSWGYYEAQGGGEAEDIDAAIRQKSEAFIEKASKQNYDNFMANANPEEKQTVVDRMKALSRDESFGSNYYRIHEGDNYVKNISDEDLIKEYFKLEARAQMFGEQNASQSLKNYWQDVVASNQSFGDKTLATGAQLMDTFSADVFSLVSVIANPLFMTVETNGSYNPKDWTVDGEGYSDALVKRNTLLKWASGLQETGCWNIDEQEKYKNLGLSKDQIYRTVEEENQFMSLNDIGDIIGQYGFTAATTLMSMGGSSAVKGLATSVARNALRTGVRGTAARSLLGAPFMKNEAKAILKNALKAGATESEITQAMEVAAEMGSKTLYRGNLGITALMGTAEGALEAKSTYDTFIKDNKARIDKVYHQRLDYLNNASRESLRDYMLSKGYESTLRRVGGDGTTYVAEFTDEQYEQAKAELLQEVNDSYQLALERMDDDAADAACANFLSNSVINGALNVFGKELSMSKDARNSIRNFKGDRKLSDLVSVEKSAADGKWHATVNKAIEANKNNSWWGDAKNAMKVNGKWNKAKALYRATKESALGKIITNAGSEGLEEFSQNVSDAASRAAFENDLNQYMQVVYDKDAREQFASDWGGIVNAGLNEITSNAVNAENIKAGLFGFLSTMGGGISPGAFIQHAHGFGQEQKEAKGVWGNVKAYSKWALSNIGGLYDGAIRQALANNNADYASAKRLQESTERWLQSDKNQELITHMGGAIGFSNMLQESVLAGDDFMTKNNHLGMAVENALMLKALKGTAMYDEYQKALQHRLSLSQITDDEEQSQIFFDQNGNLITSNLIENAPGVVEDTQTSQIKDTAQNLQSLISQFKNTNSQNFTSGMTDLEIIQRIAKNAQEMLDLNNRVERASQTLAKVFHQQDVDPLIQSAYIYAMISQEDARNRRNNLTQDLTNAVKVTEDNIFNDEEKAALTTDAEQSLNQAGINLAVEYGSIDNAIKERKKLQKQRNQLDEDAHSKKTKGERKQAKEQKKVVEAKLRALDNKLRRADIETTEQQPQQEVLPVVGQPTIQGEGTTIDDTATTAPVTITLGDASVQSESSYPLISVRDLINMSPKQRFEVLSNRSRFSDKQNAVIDQFINITRKGLSAQRNDPTLQNDEVIADYKDQYKLIEKSKAYDNLLQDYINNPRFLNDRARELQAQDRTRTLRYLYREDLQLKEGETPLDMRDRIQGKIEDLKSEEKYFDAETLQKLVSENKDIAKLQETVSNILQLQIAVAMTSPSEVKKPEFDKAIMALQALAANSNKSLEEIKEMLDNNDVDGITKILKGQLNNGEYTLNRYFKQVGIEAIADMETEDFTSLIQTVKNYVDMYYQIKAQGERQGNAQKVQGAAQPSVHQDPASQHQGPATPAQTVNEDGSEPITLKVLSPGEVQTNTPQGIQLAEFLKQHQVSSAVHNLKNEQGLQVHFMVTMDYGTPQVFAVVELKNVAPKKGVHYNINGKNYQIIGAIDASQSKGLATSAANTFATLNDSDNRSALLQGDTEALYSDFNKLDASSSVGELNQEDSKPLTSLLGNNIDRIKLWVNEFISGGKRKDVKNEDEEQVSTFVDQYGYPVTIKNAGDVHLKDFPIGNTTLEKLLNSNTDPKEIIKELKKNKFFETFFTVWESVPATTTLKDTSLYSKLIGDFFFLGYNYENVSTQENRLNAKVENGNLSVDNWNHEAKINFLLPMSASTTAEKDARALEALRTILANTIGDDRNFTYAKPQLNWKIIENTRGTYNASDIENEKARIQGLIEAGLLYGFAPSAISRNMLIRNPFTKNSSSPKPVGGTNNGAPNMDPSNAGSLPGGAVDLATGQVIEGNPQTTQDKVEQQLTEAVQRAKAIVDNLIARSKQVVLNGNQGYRSESTDTNYGRVTSAEQAFIGANTTPWQGTEQEQTISTAFGNIIDNTFRAALDILNSHVGLIDSELLYNKVLQDPVFAGKTQIPCHSKYQIKKVLQDVIIFKQLCDAKGWHIVPKDIRAFGQATVTQGGVTVGTIPVAGTLDILVYDNEGIFHIIDMKTKNMDANIDTKIQDSSEGWTAQVSTYQALLQQMYPDMQFGQNYIMPIGVKYNLQSANPVIQEDGMTVEGQMATKEPQMLAAMHGKKYNTVLEDYLYPIDTRAFNGYDFDRLSEADKNRVVPINQAAATNLVITSAPTAAPVTSPPSGPVTGGTMADAMDGINMDDFMSTRTKRQSRFTEFVNNHVANVVRPKLNIVSKAMVKLKELVTHTGYVDKIVKQDLANTFFDGDTEKFERICGKDVSVSALPQIISAIRDYYTAYSSNRAWYVQNISHRHQAASLVYQLLNDQITAQELEDELSKMNVEAQNIPELVEYFTSDNPEEAAKSILSKLEKSKLHTVENYRQKLSELTNFMDSIDAKLDFLNSGMALSMLSTRVSSIRESVLSNNVEEMSYEKSESIDDLLSGKQGNYGAQKLLRDIATRSKNKQFRKLAARLLKEVKVKNLSINVTIDNGQITNVEGESNGKNITIHKASLDNYEHLERVLLHEMLHSVVKASPEIREMLQGYLDNTISQLMKTTDMTKEEIINQHYGLTNVDEFISEYFTNLAFQESLKGIADNTESFNSIYDKITHAVKSFFTGEKSVYDEVTPIMEHLIGTHNTESTKKSTIEDNSSLVKTQFSKLEGFQQQIITKKGFTAKEFDNLPSVLQEVLTKCCL